MFFLNKIKIQGGIIFFFLFSLLISKSGFCQYVDPNEPNDTFAQATSFTIPAHFKVDIDPVGDVDFYKFAAQKGDTIDVSLNDRGSATYPRVQLYDSMMFNKSDFRNI